VVWIITIIIIATITSCLPAPFALSARQQKRR
jgi:hypothetical protein